MSVIVPTYNRPEDLRDNLAAILAGIHPMREVLVMDQSEEGVETREVVAAFADRRLRYFHVQPKGKSRALNLAMSASKGDILCFTDDDCLPTPNWVQVIADEFEADSDLCMLFGQTLPKLLTTDARVYATTVSSERRIFIKHRNPYNVGGGGGNLSLRRKTIDRIGYFDENLGPGAPFEAVEDNEYIYRALKLGLKAVYSPGATVYHVQRLDKWGAAQRLRAYRRGDGAFIAKYLLRLDPVPLAFYLKLQIRRTANALLDRDLPYLKRTLRDFKLTMRGIADYVRWRYKRVQREESRAS